MSAVKVLYEKLCRILFVKSFYLNFVYLYFFFSFCFKSN